MNWNFDILTDSIRNLPDELAATWDDAVEKYGDVWQCRLFAETWESSFINNEYQQTHILHAYSDAGHRILYPVYSYISNIYGVPRTIVESFGGMKQFDYQNPVSIGLQLTSSDWHSFWQALNINICRFFKKLGRFTNYRLTESYLAIPSTEAKKTDISPYLPLNDVTSLDDILTNCGSSHRANVRRRLRNASKIGDVSLNHVAPKQLDEILEMMFKTHIEQWASRGQNSLFMKPQFRSFFHKLARIALNLNKLHFTYVTVDEEIWHIHFGLTHRDSLLWYKPTFISRFSKHSPGIIHLALLIEDCIKKGIGEIDFGYGGESYKSLWSTHSRNLYTYEVLGNDPVLTFMRAADTGRKKIYHSRLCSYLRWKLGNRRA